MVNLPEETLGRNTALAGTHGEGNEAGNNRIGDSGLQVAKGGLEVGLGSVDRGGSCWW